MWRVLVLILAWGQVITSSGGGLSVVSGTGRTETVTHWLLLFGDSKTSSAASIPNGWVAGLPATGATTVNAAWQVVDVGVSGRTVATTLSAINTMLAGMPAFPSSVFDLRVLINLGVNDITGGLPVEATWNANYLAILDAIHTKWPTAKVYLMRPWLQGFDTDADTVAARIALIIAARSSFVSNGPDERIWLKGSDNGVTNTVDGTHYSQAGNAACVVQWAAVLY